MIYTGNPLLVDNGPSLDRFSVERHRLVDKLLESFEHGAAAIIASAGFGKTTLLAQFAQALSIPVAHISIREGDEDATWMAARISAAVAAATATPLDEWVGPDSLGHWLNSSGPEAFALLVDDLQKLPDESPGARLLAGLLGSSRNQYFILLSSRVEPAWDSFKRRKHEGSLTIVRTEDLKFSAEEVELAVAQAGADPEGAAAILDLTGGWPLALSLSLKRGGRLDLFAIDNLDESFEREIIAPMTTDAQRALSLSGALSRLTAETVGLLRPELAPGDLASWWDSGFVVRRAEASGWAYEFHALFRDYLVRRAGLLYGEDLVSLRLRAAAHYRQREDWIEAASHLAACSAWEPLDELLAAAAPALRRTGRWQTILSILQLMPADPGGDSIAKVLWRARALTALAHSDDALALLSVIEEARLTETERGEMLSVQAALLLQKGLVQEAEALGRSAVRLLAKAAPGSMNLADCNRTLANVMTRRGNYARAAELLVSALRVYERAGASYESAATNELIGINLSQRGDFAAALSVLEKALTVQQRSGNELALARLMMSTGIARYRLGFRAEALKSFTDALRLARRLDAPQIECFALMNLARLAQFGGELETALSLFEGAAKIASDIRDAVAAASALASSGNVLRRMGRREEGERRLVQAEADARERGARREQALYSVWIALGAMQDGELDKASQRLEEAVQTYEAIAAEGEPVASARYLLACVCYSQRQRRRCLELLRLVTSDMERFGSNIIDEAVRERPEAAQYAGARRQESDRWHQILARVAVAGPARGGSPTPAELTQNHVVLTCLGEVSLRVNGRQVLPIEWRSITAVELLAYLIWKKRPVRALDAAAELWPDIDRAQAMSRFHSNLYRIRRALYPGCITEDNKRYSVNPLDVFELDVCAFEDQHLRGEPAATPAERAACFAEATAAYGGPLAEEFFSEWATSLRQQLSDSHLEMQVALGQHALSQGRNAEAAAWCEKVLTIDRSYLPAIRLANRIKATRVATDVG